MLHTYYLGANTPEGFHSEYDTLQRDPRIRKLIILKGGPGCGKSTLMRTVGEMAVKLGLNTEQIPCSSDPDSLDGLVIPELQLALADGTAPHVIEPALCGCGSNYVNLGACYREDLLRPIRPALEAAKAANAACYGPAYAALAAAAGVRQLLHDLARQARNTELLDRAKKQLTEGIPASAGTPGGIRRCYLSAITPSGLRTCLPECKTLWGIRDSFGLAGGLIRDLAKLWSASGQEVVLAMDPMDPSRACGLYLPERSIGYWRADPVFEIPRTMLWIDLDASILETLPGELRERVGNLNRLRGELTAECVFWLRRAKAQHDILEELCRPAVDFAAVERQTERIIQNLLTEADRSGKQPSGFRAGE